MLLIEKLPLLCAAILTLGSIVQHSEANAETAQAGDPSGISRQPAVLVKWRCPDGGNGYVGKSASAGLLVFTNNGPGDVMLEVQSFFPWVYDTYLVKAGDTQPVGMSANRHVQVFDPHKDCLPAKGTCWIP
ncbi:MAG TPA: hypothetical protein EYQ25_02740 [Planctomycetes bacterium]|nr:hypothetical protein [Planctomycetota bacterium]HIL36313.1 hypothetical protein [Planctomycetota bacterium]